LACHLLKAHQNALVLLKMLPGGENRSTPQQLSRRVSSSSIVGNPRERLRYIWEVSVSDDFIPDPLASQQFTEAIFNTPAPAESEDCLYLNVFAPSTPAPKGGRAVMFW